MDTHHPQLVPHVVLSRAEEVAQTLRDQISNGELVAGERLAEVELASRENVSRNTLREAFRLLRQEGLVTQIPNRGTFVSIPSLTTITDIYRIRRIIECHALSNALPMHPALRAMRTAVEDATSAAETGEWVAVGTSNIRFHRAVVELTDSPRLTRLYQQLTAELRLTFSVIDDPKYLHAPFHDYNQRILQLLEAGENNKASDYMFEYLSKAEQILSTGYQRLTKL